MCTVSVIHDYARTRIPVERWTRDSFNDLQEILRRLDALDRKLDQPDCHDPEKAEWMKAIEKRLTKLERGASAARG